MTDFERQPDAWPLERGETLSNHDWFPFYGHRFLGSKFVSRCVMTGQRADIGTAMLLVCEAMRQDPAGTLPDDDLELASLAKFGAIEDWLAVRASVLHGWEAVLVKDGRTGESEVRLGHTALLEEIVASMHRRKRGRDGAREAATVAVRKSRIRGKMAELKVPQSIIRDDNAVSQLAEYFEKSPLYITADNVKAALIDVLQYTGRVVDMTQHRAPP